MKCAAGHEATAYRVPHPLFAAEIDLHRCAPCRREYVIGRDGIGRWLRRAGFCDGCDAPTWHFVTHPTTGHDILLWPKPTTRFAYLLTPDGPGTDIYRDYCPACRPEVGAAPRRIIAEIDGVPIATAVCIDHLTPHTKYAHLYSGQYGAWLDRWLDDHLHVDAETHARLLAQWEADRMAGMTSSVTA